MKNKNKKDIISILNNIINKKDFDNTLSFNDLNKMTEFAYSKNTVDIIDVLNRIKSKLNQQKVFIRKKDDSFEILIFLGNRYDIFNVKLENEDLIIKNALFEKPFYDNLVQLVGEELIECYKIMFNCNYNIDNYIINEEDYSILYKCKKSKSNNNRLRIEFNDKDETFIEKKIFDDDIKIGTNSYTLMRFIDENKELLLEGIRVSKEKCPKELLDNYMENKIKSRF